MKKYLLGIPAMMLFILSCNPPGEKKSGSGQTDSATIGESHKAPKEGETSAAGGMKVLTGANIVKSEAPDAETPSDQGYAMPRDDNGKSQSPINILTQDAKKGGKTTISIAIHGDLTTAENLGHTVQLDFSAGTTESVEGKALTAKQVHFHTPSEHLIDGMTYPLEMHIVGTVKDTGGTKVPSYVVIGVLFRMGKENSFIRKFQDMVPKQEGKQEIQGGNVPIDELFSEMAKAPSMSFYTYEGSLTTPPFTEAVHWVILDHPLEASPEQIMIIEKLEGNNARHVQAVNNRKISDDHAAVSLH